MTSVLHIFAGKRWSGDATLALHAARSTGGIVATEGPAERLKEAGIADVRQLNLSGLFGALNLSRLLRLCKPETLVVHSPKLMDKAHQAVKLAEMTIAVEEGSRKLNLPANPVQRGENLLVWVGYITPECGLRGLIEALKERPELRLRVIGNGEAKTVGPLLRIASNPLLKERIEWLGEKTDIFPHLHGSSAAIITCPNPESTIVYQEFLAAGLPVITSI